MHKRLILGLVARQALRFCASLIAREAKAPAIERSFVSDIGSQPVQPVPRASRWPELSIVVPVHNEADNLPLLVERLRTTLNGKVESWEVVFVDDGSRDETLAVIRDLNLADGARLPPARPSRTAPDTVRSPAAVPAADFRRAECAQLALAIERWDAQARQPQSAQTQDWIAAQRRAARDRQFALRC